MSVIVIGMDMPDTCCDCELYHDGGEYGEYGCCEAHKVIFGAEDDWKYETRPNWCPLRPLPEKHGDLVDISQEVNIEYFDDMNQEWSWKAGTVADALVVCEEFPMTIVEAEGE